jgi:hypothetical protein
LNCERSSDVLGVLHDALLDLGRPICGSRSTELTDKIANGLARIERALANASLAGRDGSNSGCSANVPPVVVVNIQDIATGTIVLQRLQTEFYPSTDRNAIPRSSLASFSGVCTLPGLKSELQHLTPGKVLRWKNNEQRIGNSGLRNAW